MDTPCTKYNIGGHSILYHTIGVVLWEKQRIIWRYEQSEERGREESRAGEKEEVTYD